MQKQTEGFGNTKNNAHFRVSPAATVNVEVTTFKTPCAMRKELPGSNILGQGLMNLYAEGALRFKFLAAKG
jgi:hypothetical protein